MYRPSLSFLRGKVGPSITRVSVEQIKRSSTPAAVYRLWLESDDGQVPTSLVLKQIEPGWPEDPVGHQRETSFYQQLLPGLDIPHPPIHYAGPEPDTSAQLVIMADLGRSHRFPLPNHTWAQDEIKLILDTYARLHASGRLCLVAAGKPEWLVARHEQRLFETAGDLPDRVKKLAEQGIWPPMPGFGSLLDRTLKEAEQLSDQPVTILHNDVYPPNCGIPVDGKGEVILVDWDMVGFGLAEMDLAFMFLQPFGSHRHLDRTEALDHYWRRRGQLEGDRPSKTERHFRQRYADALWALWLIPVAYRMASSPFPNGSPPQIYWDSMFGILGERLLTLCNVA